MSQLSGRVLVVDDDMERLTAVSEALRAKGHEVHAFSGGAEARASLGPGNPHLDVVIATADVANELDELRRQGSRNAAWILRADPKAQPPQRGMFIASLPVDASPSAVTETVAAAMFIRRPKKAPMPTRGSMAPSTPEPTSTTKQEPRIDRAPSHELRSSPVAAHVPKPPHIEQLFPEESLEDERKKEEQESAPSHDETSKTRCIGVVARDAKIVRRLCESFEEAGLSARGFISARTALDVVSHQHFHGLVVEERLDELDAGAFANRIAAKLGARTPRIVVLARPETHIDEPAVTARVRAPATPAAILETLLQSLDETERQQPTQDETHRSNDVDAEVVQC
jgi:CheY-like chemotaxis protein